MNKNPGLVKKPGVMKRVFSLDRSQRSNGEGDCWNELLFEVGLVDVANA